MKKWTMVRGLKGEKDKAYQITWHFLSFYIFLCGYSESKFVNNEEGRNKERDGE